MSEQRLVIERPEEEFAGDIYDSIVANVGLRGATQVSPTMYMIALTRTEPITREDMARFYRRMREHAPDSDWEAVDRAIVERWSEAALKYIKRKPRI